MTLFKKLFIVYIIQCFLFLAVFLYFPGVYADISSENSIIENLTFIALFLSGLLLIFSAKNYIKYIKILFYLAGTIFIVSAAREINLGQVIFDGANPDFYKGTKGFNNIGIFFNRFLDLFIIVFVIICSLLKITGKNYFFRIPIVNFPILMCFAITPFFHQYNSLQLDFYHLVLFPFMAFLVYGVYRNKSVFYLALTSLITILCIATIHSVFNDYFSIHDCSANEFKEYLFAFCCLGYSFQIFRQSKLNDN